MNRMFVAILSYAAADWIAVQTDAGSKALCDPDVLDRLPYASVATSALPELALQSTSMGVQAGGPLWRTTPRMRA